LIDHHFELGKEEPPDIEVSAERTMKISQGLAYLFIGLTSSTRLSKACPKGVVVEAVEEVSGAVSLDHESRA
jgi:hypothetical protein